MNRRRYSRGEWIARIVNSIDSATRADIAGYGFFCAVMAVFFFFAGSKA